MCNDNCVDLTQVTIPTGADGSAGADGTNGTNGSDGLFGGYSGNWIYETSTAPNPGVTKIRFDDTVLANIATMYISDTNADSIVYHFFLESFKNNGTGTPYYGKIKVWKRFDSTQFIMADVTGVTDNGADHSIDLDLILSNGSFSVDDELVVSFVANGADATAATDPEVVLANLTGGNTVATIFTTIVSTSLPANTLTSNGDQIVGTTYFGVTAGDTYGARVSIGGNIITLGSSDWVIGTTITTLRVDFTITRNSSTTGILNMSSYFINSSGDIKSSKGHNDVAFPMTWSGSIPIVLSGKTTAGLLPIAVGELLIKKFNA